MKIKLIKLDPAGVILNEFEVSHEEPIISKYGLASHRYLLKIGKCKYWVRSNGELEKF